MATQTKTNTKEYNLIVSDRHSLSNETDANPIADYSPGIWSIDTDKKTLKWAQNRLDDGNKVTVVCRHDKYKEKANEFIDKLGLDQDKFAVPEKPESDVSNDRPKFLSQLKRYFKRVDEITIEYEKDLLIERNGGKRRTAEVIAEKDTSVKLSDESKPRNYTYLYYEKAKNWTFHNDRATLWEVQRDEGWRKVLSVVYDA